MQSSIFHVNNEYKLALPHGSGLLFISLNQVIYFSSDNIYCRLHTCDVEVLTILASIKQLELALCEHHFIRIHKQYIVNLDMLNLYSKTDGGFVSLGEVNLPVSRARRQSFLDRFYGSEHC